MSYILEALKKLEKERKRGRIPGLSEQDSVVYHTRRRSVWPYLLIVVFSLNAALLIWWFLPKNSNDNVLQAAPSSLPSAAPAVIQNVKRPEIRESGNVISSIAGEPSSVSRPQVSPPEKDAVLRERLQSLRKMMQEDEQKQAEALPQEKKSEVMAEPLPEKKLYKLSELPSSVRDSLPGFSITAFLYSDSPSGRMARINERMMREGQELEPGLRIEEIVSDGVILSYRKFRFFVSLKKLPE